MSDKAGNPASVDHTLTVDVTVPAVTINAVAGDDVINVTEHAQAQIVSGSATGAAAGDTVAYVEGAEASAPFDSPAPVDAYCAGIVEKINIYNDK